MNSRIACVAFAAIAVGYLEAGTVLHYTFDSGAVGDVVANGSTIVNAASPGVHDATVYGNVGQNLNPSSTLMPCYTNGIPVRYRIYDSVSGTAASGQDRALRFRATDYNTHSGILQVENDAALRPESFTVEAMVHYPKDFTFANWNVIAVQPAVMKCANADAWGFRFVSTNRVAVRFAPPQTFKLKSGKTDEYESATGIVEVTAIIPRINDGRWHHVAFTCEPNASDPTKTDVKVFLDYAEKASNTLSFRPFFSTESNCPMWIGANRQTAGNFLGEIGEFRFSDAALSKEQFLRPRAAEYDPDVVLYYDFEDVWFGSYSGAHNVQMPLTMDGYLRTDYEGAGTFPCITNDSPYAKMRPCRAAFSSFTSESCLENGYTNDVRMVNNYLNVQLLDDWFSKTNFTIECFYKSKGAIKQYTPLVYRKGGAGVQFNLGVGDAEGILYGAVCPEGATASGQQRKFYDTSRSDDEQWHHAAMVVRQGESVKLYRDWSSQPVAQTTITTNLCPRSVEDWEGALYIAGGYNRNAFNGRLDEVRITLRALEPKEFICPFTPLGMQIIFK